MAERTDKGSFSNLEDSVLTPGMCSGCASCVIACAWGVLVYDNGQPRLSGECKACALCLRACPRYQQQWRELDEFLYNGLPDKEAVPWGSYSKISVARASDAEVRQFGQDAGVVSTLLILALETGLVQGALVSGLSSERPQFPQPTVARSRAEVLKTAGSRYTYSANLLALPGSVKAGLDQVALVGTPCQITAWRQLQRGGLKKYLGPVKLAIGLFCSKTFSYEGLIEEKLAQELGINLTEITGFQIKGKLLVYLRSGETMEIPLKEVQKYARNGCAHCGDFTAEYADISVGAIGTDGWNLVIVRTRAGQELFNQAVAADCLETRSWDDFPVSQELLFKMARQQRKRVGY
ncbi:MAG: Coenzyme F420 hydrogenase/dehydrogenase, beta subunit C-terminal domain [Desulfitobacteriaceae bacterium]